MDESFVKTQKTSILGHFLDFLSPPSPICLKPGSVTFLNLRCLTSCKKIRKKLMICCSCIADGLTEEHSQIYRTLVLGRVPNQFLYHVDVMDFELQYRCTLLKGFGWSYFFTRSDTSRNCSRQKSINLEQRQQRWQQSKIKIK